MMHRMKLWDTNLCPCCQVVPEYSTSHLYLCPHAKIASTREQLYKDILQWLKTVDTEPVILHLITSLWYGKQPNLPSIQSTKLRKMWNTLVDIGTQSMWKGLLPKDMCSIQHDHYKLIGSRRTGMKWGTELTGKLLRASLNLWLERCAIVHAQTADGIKGMERIALDSEIRKEKRINLHDMNHDDYYLLSIPLDKLLQEPVEVQRGWLCSVKIARGDLAGARLESLKDRSGLNHKQPSLSASEKQRYNDWRNVRLQD